MDIDELQLLRQSKAEREVLLVLLIVALKQTTAFQGIRSTFGLICLLAILKLMQLHCHIRVGWSVLSCCH